MRWDPCLLCVPQDLAKQTGLVDCLPGGLGRPSTTNSGASACDLRPRSDCQSG